MGGDGSKGWPEGADIQESRDMADDEKWTKELLWI